MENKPVDILLVEDNPDHSRLIIKELNQAGRMINKIFPVKDGREALDFLFRQGDYKDPANSPRPGLVLLDLKLPRVDGLEVLKKIKSDKILKVIPVVILTTSSHDEDIVKSYQNGTNSYITKPVRFTEFVKVINEIKLYWSLLNRSPDLN